MHYGRVILADAEAEAGADGEDALPLEVDDVMSALDVVEVVLPLAVDVAEAMSLLDVDEFVFARGVVESVLPLGALGVDDDDDDDGDDAGAAFDAAGNARGSDVPPPPQAVSVPTTAIPAKQHKWKV